MTDYDEQSVQIAVTVKGQADAEKALEQAKALLDSIDEARKATGGPCHVEERHVVSSERTGGRVRHLTA